MSGFISLMCHLADADTQCRVNLEYPEVKNLFKGTFVTARVSVVERV